MKLLKKGEFPDLAVALRTSIGPSTREADKLSFDRLHAVAVDHIKGNLPRDLRFNIDSAWKLFLYEGKIGYEYVQNSTKKAYLDCGLYAYEDTFSL